MRYLASVKRVSIPEKREIPFEASAVSVLEEPQIKFQSLRKGKYPSKPATLLVMLWKRKVSIPEKREIPFEAMFTRTPKEFKRNCFNP